MRLSALLPFDRMEELSFKPVAGGWLFQAPSPWVVGRRPHYLVNEEQKAALTACLPRMWRNLLLATVVAIAIGVPIAMSFGLNQHPIMLPIGGGLLGLLIAVVVVKHAMRRTRPRLGDLQSTELRISQKDAIRRQIEVFSPKHVLAYGVLSLVLFLAAMGEPLLSSGRWDAPTVMGAILFGAGTIYWAALNIAKRRSGRLPRT